LVLEPCLESVYEGVNVPVNWNDLCFR